MFCSRCGAQLPEGSVRCFQCDERLQAVHSRTDTRGPHDTAVKSERTWAAVCHAIPLIMFFTAIPGAVASLVVWLIKRDDSPFIDENGKEAINFQITALLCGLACIPFCFILIGFLMLLVLVIYVIIASLRAASAAYNGEMYRYRLCLRLIR